MDAADPPPVCIVCCMYCLLYVVFAVCIAFCMNCYMFSVCSVLHGGRPVDAADPPPLWRHAGRGGDQHFRTLLLSVACCQVSPDKIKIIWPQSLETS